MLARRIVAVRRPPSLGRKRSSNEALAPGRILYAWDETAAKVSMISSANGALSAESWNAIPYKRFLELTQEI